jgi:hypothetical protein
MNLLRTLCVVTACITSGCASTSMLPKSAAEADFDSGVEGKTGWSKYQETARFDGITTEQAFNAAKIGLGAADFALVSANRDLGVVMGQHGMTMHDWNIVAGVYFRERMGGCDVKVIAEGSKDIGFSGDATSGGWTGRILNGMRSALGRNGAGSTTDSGAAAAPKPAGQGKQ